MVATLGKFEATADRLDSSVFESFTPEMRLIISARNSQNKQYHRTPPTGLPGVISLWVVPFQPQHSALPTRLLIPSEFQTPSCRTFRFRKLGVWKPRKTSLFRRARWICDCVGRGRWELRKDCHRCRGRQKDLSTQLGCTLLRYLSSYVNQIA